MNDRPGWLPEQSWPWRSRAFDTPVGRIAVTDIGAGPTLLFVHVGAWSFVWRDLLLLLQDKFRCVTVDAPGCGLSERMPGAVTLAAAGEAVTSVIDALGLRDVVLVAHDLGGPAGFLAASRRPDRIAGLCAVNCFAWQPTGALFRGMLALMGSEPVRWLDGHVGWLPTATSTRFGVGRHWDARDRSGVPRRHRPGRPAGMARLL